MNFLGTFPKKTQPRKFLAAVAVLALHIALVAALIIAMQRTAPIAPARFIELLVRAPPHARTILLNAPEPPRLISVPDVIAPQIDIEPNAPTLPSASALTGIGRALFGCDIDKLGTLPPEERAGCLHLPMGHPQEPRLRLGPYDESSPFAQVIAKRNAPAIPMEHACAPNEGIQSNLGLPCYGFPKGVIEGVVNGTK